MYLKGSIPTNISHGLGKECGVLPKRRCDCMNLKCKGDDLVSKIIKSQEKVSTSSSTLGFNVNDLLTICMYKPHLHADFSHGGLSTTF